MASRLDDLYERWVTTNDSGFLPDLFDELKKFINENLPESTELTKEIILMDIFSKVYTKSFRESGKLSTLIQYIQPLAQRLDSSSGIYYAKARKARVDSETITNLIDMIRDRLFVFNTPAKIAILDFASSSFNNGALARKQLDRYSRILGSGLGLVLKEAIRIKIMLDHYQNLHELDYKESLADSFRSLEILKGLTAEQLVLVSLIPADSLRDILEVLGGYTVEIPKLEESEESEDSPEKTASQASVSLYLHRIFSEILDRVNDHIQAKLETSDSPDELLKVSRSVTRHMNNLLRSLNKDLKDLKRLK